MNVGASGILRHYPPQDVTVVVLAVGEHAAWGPVEAIDRAVASFSSPDRRCS